MNDVQIENLRKLLMGQIGVAAFFLTRDDIIALRDRFQAQINAVEHCVQADEFCGCDPNKQGKTIHRDGRVECNKCHKTRR